MRTSQRELAYVCLLTPAGVATKMNLTAGFLKRKSAEYEELWVEIEKLRREVREWRLLEDCFTTYGIIH